MWLFLERKRTMLYVLQAALKVTEDGRQMILAIKTLLKFLVEELILSL